MRGQSFRLVQFCNDWISADAPNGQPVILNPVAVTLETEEEVNTFLNSDNPGIFWMLFEYVPEERRFKRKRREVARESVDLSQ